MAQEVCAADFLCGGEQATQQQQQQQCQATVATARGRQREIHAEPCKAATGMAAGECMPGQTARRRDVEEGRDAVLRKKDAGLDRRLVQFKLNDPEPLLYHNEPVMRDGKVVSFLTSGGYGHHLGAALGMGYVPCRGETVAEMLASTYEIDVMGRRVKAEASLKPFYDPTGERAKA